MHQAARESQIIPVMYRDRLVTYSVPQRDDDEGILILS